MPTKKQQPAAATTDESLAYETAMKGYASALGLLRKGDFERAKEQLRAVQIAAPKELELVDRAEIYLRVCDRRLAQEPDTPSGRELYRQAVFLSNAGDWDAAIELPHARVDKDHLDHDDPHHQISKIEHHNVYNWRYRIGKGVPVNDIEL